MQLLDRFAAAALQNLGPLPRNVSEEEAAQIAADAYEIAGAMMAQRAIIAEAVKANRTRTQ